MGGLQSPFRGSWAVRGPSLGGYHTSVPSRVGGRMGGRDVSFPFVERQVSIPHPCSCFLIFLVSPDVAFVIIF